MGWREGAVELRFWEKEDAADRNEPQEGGVEPPKASPTQLLSHRSRDDRSDLQMLEVLKDTWEWYLTIKEPK